MLKAGEGDAAPVPERSEIEGDVDGLMVLELIVLALGERPEEVEDGTVKLKGFGTFSWEDELPKMLPASGAPPNGVCMLPAGVEPKGRNGGRTSLRG